MKKPVIIISIPLVWGVRNVIESGLYDILRQRFEIVLALPVEGLELASGLPIPPLQTILLRKALPSRRAEWALRVLKAAHARKSGTVSDKILGHWVTREQGIKKLAISILSNILSLPFSLPSLFPILEWVAKKAFLASIPKVVWEDIDSLMPAAALSTSYVVPWEWPLFMALQKRGIPSLTHILSFDNLTSRGYIPLWGFHKYLVWQDKMANELEMYYSISRNRIAKTGTPQFSFHTDPELIMDEPTVITNLRLDPKRPYAVYCANHEAITPNEPALFQHLITLLKSDQELCQLQFILRIHPMDNYARWSSVENLESVRINHPWNQNEIAKFWGSPTRSQLGEYGNILRHSAMTLTIASSSALDSCVVDTPVLCIGYHPSAPEEESRFYHDVHYSHHFLPIISSGALALANSPGEVISNAKGILKNRDRLSLQRRKLVEQLCGKTDTSTILSIADQVSKAAGLGGADAKKGN